MRVSARSGRVAPHPATVSEASPDAREQRVPRLRTRGAVLARSARGFASGGNANRSRGVNLLYSTDTVGGNSGSPVLNARGEFVAINFDRQRQGLMNEYKWSRDFSRSIGVDVRYILWLVGDYDNAGHLVSEMTRP